MAHVGGTGHPLPDAVEAVVERCLAIKVAEVVVDFRTCFTISCLVMPCRASACAWRLAWRSLLARVIFPEGKLCATPKVEVPRMPRSGSAVTLWKSCEGSQVGPAFLSTSCCRIWWLVAAIAGWFLRARSMACCSVRETCADNPKPQPTKPTSSMF
ncbi:MAG: hypothetical protein IPN76_00710 [Saprospiraceae bacterium]|nr:hypothetical protein [Saprospiraceae bacterium]